MGWHGMGGSLGIAAGPAYVGTALAVGWSWRPVAGLLVIPGLLALALLAIARLPSETSTPVPGSSRPQVALLSRSFAFILLVYMFAGFAYQGGLTFLPRFVGAGFFALALALGAIGQVLSGRLADRRRFERILFALSVAAAAILVLLAVLPLGGAFIAAALVFGFLLFSLEPLQNTLVTGEVPRPLRGTAFGFTFLSVFGIGSLGAALAGWLLARNANAILFLVLGGCLAASGAFSLGVRRAAP
jgi:MFS family permease